MFPLQARLWPRGWVEVQLYSSMTTALEGGEWSAASPGHTLPPGKTQYPLYRRLGGPQGRSGRAENLTPSGFDPRTAEPIVSRYTYWATRPTNVQQWLDKKTVMFLQSTTWIYKDVAWSSLVLLFWYKSYGHILTNDAGRQSCKHLCHNSLSPQIKNVEESMLHFNSLLT